MIGDADPADQHGPGVLSADMQNEFASLVEGEVYFKPSADFEDFSRMFNGNIISKAKAVVCPLHAQDISEVMNFCNAHKLFPSTKAGGYGTAGWAVGGDIIIDLGKLTDVDLEIPGEDGAYTSIRNMAPHNSKGKNPIGKPMETQNDMRSGKRRREDEDRLRTYDDASLTVAEFLRDQSPTSLDGQGQPEDQPPNNRRRLHVSLPALDTPQLSSGSAISGASSVRNTSGSPSAESSLQTGSPYQGGSSTSLTTPLSSHAPSARAKSSDPFDYLDDNPATSASAFVPSPKMPSSGGPNSLFSAPGFLESHHNLITHATPIHPFAYLTFGSGLRQKEVDRFSSENPLPAISLSGGYAAIPYHIPFAAHPAGSGVMLHGGLGFLSRLYGLSTDNLVEAEVVLADGRIVVASEKENPDLWWALRGAGSAFGIVTRYKAKAFPIPVVYAGNLIYRFDRATAASLIKHFRDCIKGAPRELYANLILTAGPEGEDSLVIIQMSYVGPRTKGQEFLQTISSWDGGQCLLNEVGEKSFFHHQDSVAQVLRGKAGNKWYIRSALINSLPDDIVGDTVIQFADSPVGCTWLFELVGGAMADFQDGCVPLNQRKDAAFTVAALHQWDISFDDPRCVMSADEWIAKTLKSVSLPGPIPSFLGRLEDPARVLGCYGENWGRLCDVKRKYDPTNIFRNSFWPLNEAGDLVPPESHEPEHIAH